MTVRAVEWKQPYTWWTAIEIDENKVISLRLRDENNLIIYDEWDDEIYVDLQLPDEITPTDAFPVWVTTGRVIVDNGWDTQWTLICAKTTSWDNIKILYADDWKLYMDNGTWSFKQIYFKADVDLIIQTLTTYINTELAKKQNWVTSDTAPINPSEWDLWYDTVNDELKVYDGTQWNTTGWWGSWDVVVSTDTGNELSTGVGLWLGTESAFSSISTPDTNTLYIQYKSEWGSTPAWAENLIGYRPLASDANDHKWDLYVTWTTYDGTWNGTAQYGTVWWRSWAYFSDNAYIDTGVNYAETTITFACSLYKDTDPVEWWACFGSLKNTNPNFWIFWNKLLNKIYVHWWDSTDTDIVSNYQTQTWYNLVVTVNWSTIKYYVNGTLIWQKSWWATLTGYNWGIGKCIWNYANGSYIANCAIWNRVLTDSEIVDFNTYINS